MTTRAAIETAVVETIFGSMRIRAVQWPGERPHVVLSNPTTGIGRAQVRIQAECLTSTAFGSMMCDCGNQIERALQMVAELSNSHLIYLPQEGRGWGLLSKVEIMRAMNTGLSLTEAQAKVGRPENRLSYNRVPELLDLTGLSGEIVLLTESEAKYAAVRAAGVQLRDISESSW